MLIDLEKIVGYPGYFIDDTTYEIWSFKRYKEGKKIKLSVVGDGYLRFNVWNECKHKDILYHQLIVRLFIDPNYDPSTQQIDHIDHNKLNNSIDNLKVVTKGQNEMNKTVYKGKQAIYIDNIGESIAVNEEHNVYYSITFDKFYRLVEHVEKYRQMHEYKHGVCLWIQYNFNNKHYSINCSKFRDNL